MATKFYEISTVDLPYVVTVKSAVEILQKILRLLRIYELYQKQKINKTDWI